MHLQIIVHQMEIDSAKIIKRDFKPFSHIECLDPYLIVYQITTKS